MAAHPSKHVPGVGNQPADRLHDHLDTDPARLPHRAAQGEGLPQGRRGALGGDAATARRRPPGGGRRGAPHARPGVRRAVQDIDTQLKITLSGLTALDPSGLTRLEL